MGQLARAIDFARRSIENPATPLVEAVSALFDSAGGGLSKAGIPVSQETATKLSAFWRGVRLLSETLASVPLCLYERQDPRGRRKATEHPLYPLMHDEWNPDMTSFFARECMQAQVVTHGNGYGAIRRDAGGRVREIWPLTSSRVEPKRYQEGLIYWMTLKDGTREPWPAGDVLHVPGLSFDGLKGKSVLGAARDVIGSGLAVQDYGATFFRHGGRPPAVIETGLPKLDPDTKKNLQETWLSGRNENWHQVAFLPKNMKYVSVGVPADDAQFMDRSKFTVPEIARILGVPPHLLYDLDRATFSNIEMQSLEFVIYTMRQYFVRWEQELNRKLLTPQERLTYYFEFQVDGLMRGDAAARGTFYSLGRQWGWLSANDVLELENRPGIGAAGDVYLTPFNMANAEEMVGGSPGQPAQTARQLLQLMGAPEILARMMPAHLERPPRARLVRELAAHTGVRGLRLRRRIRKAQVPIIEDRARVIVRREIGAIEKELKALAGRDGRNRRDLRSLRAAIDEFYAEHAGWSGKKMHPIVQVYGEIIAGAMADELGLDAEADPPPELDRFIAEYSKRFGIREASEGRLQLLALTEEGDEEEVAAAIRTRLGEWDEKRAGKIAAIEATRQMEAVAKVLLVAAGFTVFRWAANPTACPFCASLDGKVAGVQQNFVAAGEDVDGGGGTDGPLKPSDNIGHPPLHDGCVPGDVRVSAEGIAATSERRFDGEMFVVRTASGKKFTSTPNHPVLTDRGWVAAETLDLGDHVVSSRAREWDAPVVGHHEHVPAAIEQVARAFREFPEVVSVPVPGSSEDFHGDGRVGEVTVVRADRMLLNEARQALLQQDGKAPFSLRDVAGAAFARQRAAALFVQGRATPLGGAVCSRHLGETLGRARADAPDQELGLRSAPWPDAAFEKPLPDRATLDAVRLGQGEFALAGDVCLDKVVHVERYPFHGLVFNLHTARGFYIAEGIISHNCECNIVAD